MRRALIDPQGVTRNIILVADEAAYALEDGWSLGDPDLNPLADTPAPVPQTVSPRQMKLAMLGAGLLDAVEAFVGQQSRGVQITWEYATEWNRDDPMLNQMAGAFGLTTSQVDDLFRSASDL